MKWLRGILGIAVLLAVTPAPAAEIMRRALVIAHNGSDDPSLPPLRFADDDGVLWAETLRRLGIETTLLVQPDETTSQSGRSALAGARPPTPEEVARAVRRLRAAHLSDRQAGRETDVLVIYVGHGNTDENGRAYFTLAQGRLDRSSFYSQVVDMLEADYVHVIVDACRASGVVGRRGQADAEILAELRGVLARDQLASRPSVGVLFAESEDGETLEWSRFRAGVFSHITRSGLMGGADINADGMVEYSELGAFVAASLHGVKGLPARLTVSVFAPIRDPRRPLAGPAPKGPTLTLPAYFEHTRISVEDAEGSRLADLRRVDGVQVALRLPERDVYWVRSPTGEARLELQQLTSAELQLKPRELQERGPAEEALRRGLFAVALDRSFYEEYVAREGLVPVDFHGVPVPRSGTAAPSDEEQSRWGLGLGVLRAPLVGTLATGPVVAWRSAPKPYYYGLRTAYALTPFARGGLRVHRLSLQAVAGLQRQGSPAFFLEASAGWALVGVTYPGGTQGDPLGIAGHVTLGGVVRTVAGPLRIGGIVGADVLSVDGKRQGEPCYGLELALRR